MSEITTPTTTQFSGNFGEFGGTYLPPVLEKILNELADKYIQLSETEQFQKELKALYSKYAGRPSRLYKAERLSKVIGCTVYLKREDLNHTGSHKINNVLGQGLLAQSMGKQKLIAETGAGQHGVATATIAAYLGMQCDIYMGARDIHNQKPNVYRMKVLGANVIPVTQGQGTLKDAVDVALTSYINEVDNAYYLLGSAVGPHPYPMMVRNFQKIIGEEIAEQIIESEGRMPTKVVACVGGGSNALGALYRFFDIPNVELVAVEPEGKGLETGRHGLTLHTGKPGVIHGFRTLVMTEEDGTVKESYSAASGLDYPGVSPELSHRLVQGKLSLGRVTDAEAVDAFVQLSNIEGIIPALESAHAIAYLFKNKDSFKADDIIVVNLSGRGDKDVENVYENFIAKA